MNPRAHDGEARRARVAELRRRYLAGTLDQVLLPDDPPLERLLRDVLGRATPLFRSAAPGPPPQSR